MMTVDSKAIGNRVRFYRLDKGLSIKQLYELTGITEPYLRNIETGLKPISISALCTISESLGIDINLLLCDVSMKSCLYKLDRILRDCKCRLSNEEFALIESTYRTVLCQLLKKNIFQ